MYILAAEFAQEKQLFFGKSPAGQLCLENVPVCVDHQMARGLVMFKKFQNFKMTLKRKERKKYGLVTLSKTKFWREKEKPSCLKKISSADINGRKACA